MDNFAKLIGLPAGLQLDQIVSFDFDFEFPTIEKDDGAELRSASAKIVALLRDAVNGHAEALAGLTKIDPLFVLPRAVDAEYLKAETERLAYIDYFALHGKWRAETRAGAVVSLPAQSRGMLSCWLRIPQNEAAVRARVNVNFPIHLDAEDASARH